MENMELTCFQIISNAGMAKSSFIAAIRSAQNGNYEEAEKQMKEGSDSLINGHAVHAGLIQNEAAGTPTQLSLLLIHAEDQMMSAELTELMAQTLIAQQKQIQELKTVS